MTPLGTDWIGRVVAFVAGAAVGLRALQVIRNFNEMGGYSSIAAGGTGFGLMFAIAFVGGLAAWRLNRSPHGTGGPRLVVLDAGIVVGALVGLVAFRAP